VVIVTVVTDRKFRDSKGLTLEDYWRPSVAVDTALLIPDPDEGLLVLEVRRESASTWALPGVFLREGERLADAVRRSLRDKAGVEGLEPHQLKVFDRLDRDDRGRVLAVGHWAMVPRERVASRFAAGTRLMPAARPGRLIYDHPEIIEEAVRHIRARYAEEPDPEGVLGDRFTMLELRRLHETIAGEPLDRDTFRRDMKDKLIDTGQKSVGTRGKPAALFRRRTKGKPRRS
jgi:8-oxo-dGTP diphosphatase